MDNISDFVLVILSLSLLLAGTVFGIFLAVKVLWSFWNWVNRE